MYESLQCNYDPEPEDVREHYGHAGVLGTKSICNAIMIRSLKMYANTMDMLVYWAPNPSAGGINKRAAFSSRKLMVEHIFIHTVLTEYSSPCASKLSM